MAHRLVLLGPPGAGKGTQATLLAKDLGIAHISTGEMMRAAVNSGNALGQRVKGFLDSGNLVPDDLVIEIIKDRLTQKDCIPGFILDGFPRTVNQAENLTKLLNDIKLPLTKVIDIVIAEEILLERIKSRGRSDDLSEVVANRLKTYWEQTAPVTAYYRSLNGVIEVNGLGTVEEVSERIKAVL